MDNVFYAVVVLYNQMINDSLTCNNLKKIINHNIKVIIADNSIIPTDNNKRCFDNGWIYVSMGGNVGLSKAYNRVLDIIEDNSGIVIWFDDDTNITQEYFDELEKKVLLNKNVDIFAPVIYGQDGKIYSPNEARFFKNKQLKRAKDALNMKKFNAINSCTAVRLKVYKNYRYNERIFLDQVDHNFFEDQRSYGRTFLKLKVVIHHNFSLKSKQKSSQQCWNRYKIMIPDFLIFCSKSKIRLLLGIIKVIGWGFREALNYHDIKFIWSCFSYGIICIKNKKLYVVNKLL
ncbi:glycosyltransferase [Clostridium tyrobutyricum]|uniref:glycosyltransferase n=1 Tax=Clostridium tyrobutyricum TaxID=1519 RepID=UPI001C3D827B|nr:glycosyltransferase [Clostridium tyrobutyricum]MBV4438481.1 glycosyltransferase [Clostridium tyrobutyricum]